MTYNPTFKQKIQLTKILFLLLYDKYFTSGNVLMLVNNKHNEHYYNRSKRKKYQDHKAVSIKYTTDDEQYVKPRRQVLTSYCQWLQFTFLQLAIEWQWMWLAASGGEPPALLYSLEISQYTNYTKNNQTCRMFNSIWKTRQRCIGVWTVFVGALDEITSLTSIRQCTASQAPANIRREPLSELYQLDLAHARIWIKTR